MRFDRDYIKGNKRTYYLRDKDVVVIGSPMIVHRHQLLDYVNATNISNYSVFTIQKAYASDRECTLVLKAIPFREDYAIILEATLTSLTGYRKYGPMIADNVFTELMGMEAPDETRLIVQGNKTLILDYVTYEGDLGFQTILEVPREDVTLLVHYEDASDKQLIYSYRGQLYVHYSSYPHSPKTKEECISKLLRHSLTGFTPSMPVPDPTFLVVDGMLCVPTRGDKIRFRVDYVTRNAGTTHATVVCGVVDDDSPRYLIDLLRTYSEVRKAIEGCQNHDEIIAGFRYVHPDLVGRPIPTLHVGDTVVIDIPEPSDPKHTLTGLKGTVVSVGKWSCEVEFFNYQKFREHFRMSELLPLSDTSMERGSTHGN